MFSLNRAAWTSAFLATVLGAGYATAADISGTISTTLTILENSRLVGDVTCTVSGAACLDIGASNVTLDLNGFTITGLADQQSGCAGANPSGAEHGIRVLQQTRVVIRGPGVVQRFRSSGIQIAGSADGSVTSVTTSTNCLSGIFVAGASNVLENNISIANGNLSSPCGGI
jgi:hypothetical protein